MGASAAFDDGWGSAVAKAAPLSGSVGRWGSRALLAGIGVIVALALIEGLLRLGGYFYAPGGGSDSGGPVSADGVYRILCLGESTTAGIDAGEQSYPDLLEDILNEKAAGKARFEVTNGGRPGTTTDVILARLPEMLEEHDPDIVVTMMGVNDGHLIDPVFQTGSSLRVWKLIEMLYHSYRPPPVEDQVEDMLVRAEAALQHRPDTTAELAAQVQQLAPADARGHLTLAEARVAQNQIESAAASYVKAFEVDAPAVVGYAFGVENPFVGVLDWVASRMPQSSDALAARAVIAFRRRDTAGAEYYSRRSTEIDPRNTVAWVVRGRVLEIMESTEEARRSYEAAVAANPRLVYLLAGDLLIGSPELAAVAAAAPRPKDPALKVTPTSQELWFRRARSELDEGLRGLHLKQSWEQIARGATQDAAKGLQGLADADDEVSARVRIRAHGQLAVLALQDGDADRAEEHHRAVEELLRSGTNPTTATNYLELHRVLVSRDIPLVAVQYPMRPLETLQRLLEPASSGVVFVDNERAFKDMLLGRPYTEIFTDLFAGDFGHLTVEGNRLLATNVSEGILRLIPEMRGD